MTSAGTHRGSHRHRAGRRRRTWAIGLLLAVLVAAGVTAVLLRDELSGAIAGGGCDEHRLRLAVDPAIAADVEEAVAGISKDLAQRCLTLTVAAADSATTAEELAREQGHGFSASPPNLWIPDSSAWLNAARDTPDGKGRIPGDAVSIATSPVVIAMRPTVAEGIGWPEAQPTWAELLATSQGELTLATPDLDRDAAGLASVAALTGGDIDRLGDVARRLSVPRLGDRSTAQLVAAGDADAAPASEQQVFAANAGAGSPRVVAAYDDSAEGALDFPLVAVEGTDDAVNGATSEAFESVVSALTSAAAQERFRATGFRDPAGEPVPEGDVRGILAEALSELKAPSSGQISAVTDQWSTGGRRSRLLVLVDRSGSMGQSLPGSSSTRAQLAQESLRRLVEESAPDSDLGLWTFTTGLATDNYEELVPTGPMDAVPSGDSVPRRDALLSAIDGLDPLIGGATPLYDSILAGFRRAQEGYAYGRFNALVVITDGRNEDPGSVSLTGLLDRLRLEYDGIRPVRIITIAYGEGVDVRTLRRIADTTGGRTYQALTGDEVAGALTRTLADL